MASDPNAPRPCVLGIVDDPARHTAADVQRLGRALARHLRPERGDTLLVGSRDWGVGHFLARHPATHAIPTQYLPDPLAIAAAADLLFVLQAETGGGPAADAATLFMYLGQGAYLTRL